MCVLIPEHITSAQLHEIIQASMGWTDDHLHQFMVSLRRRAAHQMPRPSCINSQHDSPGGKRAGPPLGIGTHVDGLDSQPQHANANHRIQSPSSWAALLRRRERPLHDQRAAQGAGTRCGNG
ncbi:IS1096 element passenger TnpR family protein [Cupriavidus lacunae]|uniref:IS1096 element passenger TnpR family protein n=1 Tax=Cupriavidus lacunae TaxID=2666307 RepID=UPI0031345521